MPTAARRARLWHNGHQPPAQEHAGGLRGGGMQLVSDGETALRPRPQRHTLPARLWSTAEDGSHQPQQAPVPSL